MLSKGVGEKAVLTRTATAHVPASASPFFRGGLCQRGIGSRCCTLASQMELESSRWAIARDRHARYGTLSTYLQRGSQPFAGLSLQKTVCPPGVVPPIPPTIANRC